MLTHLSIKRATALALTLGAITAVPASAMPNQASGPAPGPSASQTAGVTGGGAQLSPRLAHAYGEQRSQVTSRTSHAITTHPRIISGAHSDSGFNWGDAGIGAAGGLALSLLVLGGAAATTRRRPRHAAGGLVQPAAR
jgi:hypothetical protein